MKFFKENSYDIIKLYVNQIGIMIFSLFLTTAVGMVEDAGLSDILSLAVSIFSVLFFYVLIYCVVWEIGARDKIKIDGGRLQPLKPKGLLLGSLANIPNVILSVLTLIFLSANLASGSGGMYSAFVVVNLLLRFHCSMYLGLVTFVTPDAVVNDAPDLNVYLVQTVLFVILPLLSGLVTHLGYTLGSKDKRLFGFLSVPKKTNK